MLTGIIGAGGSRADAAMAILTSTDYQGLFVNGLYMKLLNRPADAE